VDATSLPAVIALVVAAYLIGAIPFGVIVPRVLSGKDPRTVGSGRTGGANVLRTAGPRVAFISGIADMLKGTAAVALVRLVGAGPEVEVLAALAAIVGHSRSIFIGFQGGRGISVGYGSLLVISPLAALISLPIFGLVFAITRYSSLASLTGSVVAGVVVAIIVLIGAAPTVYLLYAIAGPVLIWIFHADNIDRLLHGRERRFGAD
jgi:acyl phosphate:glycerol-3-phosphate acyltransferase